MMGAPPDYTFAWVKAGTVANVATELAARAAMAGQAALLENGESIWERANRQIALDCLETLERHTRLIRRALTGGGPE